jgi:hypothetical protein
VCGGLHAVKASGADRRRAAAAHARAGCAAGARGG